MSTSAAQENFLPAPNGTPNKVHPGEAYVFVTRVIIRISKRMGRDPARDVIVAVEPTRWGGYYQTGRWSAMVQGPRIGIPLIISPPGGMKGTSTDAPVELVDIYPTLLELAGIEKPDHLTGVGLVPLLKNPEMDWKDATFSWWRNGRTIHTSQHTYTEWIKGEQVVGRMLFDCVNDPQGNVNIAGLAENKSLIEKLHRILEKRNTLAK